MNEKLVIIIPASAIFNLSMITVLSWIKSAKHPFYFWLGWMFFAACMAILNNICIFIDVGNIYLYHLALLFNLSWGTYLILFIKNLRSSGKQPTKFNWKPFIPSILYIPSIALCIIKSYWAHDTISYAEQGKMTVIGVLCNLTICFYSVITNIYLIRKVYVNKDYDSKSGNCCG